MTTRLITPPAALAVALALAKENLKQDADLTDSDALITAWIHGITSHAEHYTGRAFITQGWRLTLDSFPDAIRLDMPPIQSVESVAYIDVDGVTQTLDPADYVVDIISEPGFIVPAPDVEWPETYDRINAVTVNYTCGYGDAATDVPDSARLFILAKLTEQFDPMTKPDRETLQSSFVDRLLDRIKVYG